MLIILQSEPYAPWLAPYAYGIVLFGIAFFLYRVFENLFAVYFNKPLFRHYLVYKKLPASQVAILENNFDFYNKLSENHRKQFNHRIVQFLSEKKIIGREEILITEQMKILIAAVACMLSFGRRNYTYSLIEYILIYPAEFFSTTNQNYHKGEFNPKERVLVLSWKDFESGLKDGNDNLNVGIHEFMHAMQIEGQNEKRFRFSSVYKTFSVYP